MPFTPAHAAAALPLRRLGLVWSALVIGTFAPDLEYFIRLSPGHGYGHTLTGSIFLSLPLAILTLWLFHSFVKAPFIELLPDGIRSRLVYPRTEFQYRGAARLMWIVVSILLGMATHLAWDSFTHANTYFYRHWPVLRMQMHLPILGIVPFYKVLQHASTILGLGALLIWFLLWYRKAQVLPSRDGYKGLRPARKATIFLVAMAVALLAGVARTVAALGIPSNHSAAKQAVGLFVVTWVAVMWWEFVLYGVSRHGMQARTADPSLRSG